MSENDSNDKNETATPTPEQAEQAAVDALALAYHMQRVVYRALKKWERDYEPREVRRLRTALRLIANGHISPSMGLAQRVLDGEDPSEALAAEIAAARARR
jgi:hypothetical protein